MAQDSTILDMKLVSYECGDREIFTILTSGILDTLSAPCNNEQSINVFNQRIAAIRTFNKTENTLLWSEVINIILNLELLTDIESESDADFIGKYRATEKDIERWEQWLIANKNNICLFEEKMILYLRK